MPSSGPIGARSRDSGRPGRFRGGVSVEFVTIPHKAVGDSIRNVTASGDALPAGLGLSGGLPGAAASNIVLRCSSILDLLAAGRIPKSPEEVTAARVDVLEAKAHTTIGDADLYIAVFDSGMDSSTETTTKGQRRCLIVAPRHSVPTMSAAC